MKRGRWVHRLLVCALVGVGVVAVGDVSQPAATVEAQTSGVGAGGEYHPVTPARIFDSRPEFAINDVAPRGKKPTNRFGADFTVRIAGLGGLPSDPSDILAVALGVTVVEPTRKGWLAVRPAGSPVADGSLVNYEANRNVPNMTIVGVSSTGEITVRLRTGQTGRAHVLIDVFGWVSTSTYDGPGQDDGSRLVPYGPTRLLDTRLANRPFERRESRAIQVLGARTFQPTTTIPNRSSIDAVLINLTGVNTGRGSQHASTFLAAADRRMTPPVATSNTNLVRGEVKATLALVPIDDNGRIHIYNHNGRTDVVVDVVAYLEVIDDDTTAGRIVPLTAPFRTFDTRDSAFGNVPLGFGSVEDWSFEEFANSVQMPGSSLDLSEQSALIGNLTATDLGRLYPGVPVSTYLTAFQGGVSRPASSNVNLTEGLAVPNMALLRYGSEGGDDYVVQVYNHNGTTHYLFDATAVVLK